MAAHNQQRMGSVVSGCLLGGKLGEGGMGSVYAATRQHDGRQVAVKFLPADYARDPSWRRRFLKTAEIVQQIDHPNVARVFSVHDAEPLPHLVMELVDGEALDQRLKRLRRLAEEEALRVARDIARGLAAAHEVGLVHRDVKPGNVLVARTGRVKVIDFGLAKDYGEQLTFAGQVLGTPSYMAPEQWGAHEVDNRCDVFSLGSTLYHLLTGRLPFRAATAQQVAALIGVGEFTPPRELNPEVSPEAELLLQRMMEHDRRFRYSSMEACARDLERVLRGKRPNVPRLEELSKQSDRRTLALVKVDRFTIGRRSSCSLAYNDRSLSREHAEIVRQPTGFMLRDLGSSGGSYVRDARVTEVMLKDRDVIRVGERSFLFREGQQGATASSISGEFRPEPQEVQTIAAPLYEALQAEADRRVVLGLIEQLDPGTPQSRLRSARNNLPSLIGPQAAQPLLVKLGEHLDEERSKLATRLFILTHEKLGDDPRAWLTWWDEAQHMYPPQVGPQAAPQPPLVLRVVAGVEPAAFELEGALRFSLGRDPRRDLHLDEESVSRLHASVLRLHTRLAIRDESSRLGTLKNGQRVVVDFLNEGDELTLGRVQLETQRGAEHAEASSVGRPTPIEPFVFRLLAEASHPATARALLGARLAAARGEHWLAEEVKELLPERDRAGIRQRVKEAVARRYRELAKLSERVLPGLVGDDDLPTDPALAEALLAERKWPTQVAPAGWPLPL